MCDSDPRPHLRGRRSECETLDRLLADVRAGPEPRPGPARRGRGRQDRAAGAPACAARRDAGSRGRRASSPRWSSRSPGCISCARRCSTGSTRCPARSATRCGVAFGLQRRATSRTASSSGWRCSSLLAEVAEDAAAASASSTTRSGSTGPRRRRWRSWRGACWRSGRDGVRRPRAQPTATSSSGLPELRASAGSPTAMRARCWTSAIPGRLDERVRDRIVAETRGNPLALLELPRGLTPAELAGGFGLPDARPLASRIERALPPSGVRALPRDDAAAAAAWRRPSRSAT